MTASGIPSSNSREKQQELVEAALARLKALKGFEGLTLEDQAEAERLVQEQQGKLSEHLQAVKALSGVSGLQSELQNFRRMSLHNSKASLWATQRIFSDVVNFKNPLAMLCGSLGIVIVLVVVLSALSGLVWVGGGDFVSPTERMEGAVGDFGAN